VVPNFTPQTEGVVQYTFPKRQHTVGKILLEFFNNENVVEIAGALLQKSKSPEKDSEQFCVYFALNQPDVDLNSLTVWNTAPSKILRKRSRAEGSSNSKPLDTAVLEVFIQQIGIESDPVQHGSIGNILIEINGTGNSKKTTRKITVNKVEFPIKSQMNSPKKGFEIVTLRTKL